MNVVVSPSVAGLAGSGWGGNGSGVEIFPRR
jgi:hypothetical protein